MTQGSVIDERGFAVSDEPETELVPNSMYDEYQKRRIEARDKWLIEQKKADELYEEETREIMARFNNELRPFRKKQMQPRQRYLAKIRKIKAEWLSNNPGENTPKHWVC